MKRGKWKLLPDFNDNQKSNLITPKLINKDVLVCNGHLKREYKFKAEHIGKKIGEMVQTKNVPMYKKKIK